MGRCVKILGFRVLYYHVTYVTPTLHIKNDTTMFYVKKDIMIIDIPSDIEKEVDQQLWADQLGIGINSDTITFEWLKEELMLDSGDIYLL